jgi:putative transposase
VIDGAKALRKAIVECFGATALIQRCQEHKRRNVIEHLPEEMHASVNQTMRDAWDSKNAPLAKKQLLRLAASLQAQHPGAAASLKEGLEETLTVQALGISGPCTGRCAPPTRSRTSTVRSPTTRATSSAGRTGR